MADEFRVSQWLIRDLRARNMNWTEIWNLLQVAEKSRQMIEDILVLREEGMSWLEIAHHYHVPVKDLKNPEIISTESYHSIHSLN